MQFSTIIRNVHLPLTETNRLYDTAVFGEQIANIAPAGEAPFASSAHTEFDAEGSYALPGFNDVQVDSWGWNYGLLFMERVQPCSNERQKPRDCA